MALTFSLIVGTVPTASTWLANTTMKQSWQPPIMLACSIVQSKVGSQQSRRIACFRVASNGRREMAHCLPNALYMPMTTCMRVAQHASSLMKWSRMGHGWCPVMMHQQHADVFVVWLSHADAFCCMLHCNLNNFLLHDITCWCVFLPFVFPQWN